MATDRIKRSSVGCQNKLAMEMASFERTSRLDPKSVTVNALHPGSLLETKMVREAFGTPWGWLKRASSQRAASPHQPTSTVSPAPILIR